MTTPRVRYPLRRSARVLGVIVACVASSCSKTVEPKWPVEAQLRLVNATTDMVFVKAVGDESLYPGIARLAPGDSGCTTINAYARSVSVEVHSLSNPTAKYGSASIDPLSSAGWHGVVDPQGVTVRPAPACPY